MVIIYNYDLYTLIFDLTHANCVTATERVDVILKRNTSEFRSHVFGLSAYLIHICIDKNIYTYICVCVCFR